MHHTKTWYMVQMGLIVLYCAIRVSSYANDEDAELEKILADPNVEEKTKILLKQIRDDERKRRDPDPDATAKLVADLQRESSKQPELEPDPRTQREIDRVVAEIEEARRKQEEEEYTASQALIDELTGKNKGTAPDPESERLIKELHEKLNGPPKAAELTPEEKQYLEELQKLINASDEQLVEEMYEKYNRPPQPAELTPEKKRYWEELEQPTESVNVSDAIADFMSEDEQLELAKQLSEQEAIGSNGGAFSSGIPQNGNRAAGIVAAYIDARYTTAGTGNGDGNKDGPPPSTRNLGPGAANQSINNTRLNTSAYTGVNATASSSANRSTNVGYNAGANVVSEDSDEDLLAAIRDSVRYAANNRFIDDDEEMITGQILDGCNLGAGRVIGPAKQKLKVIMIEKPNDQESEINDILKKLVKGENLYVFVISELTMSPILVTNIRKVYSPYETYIMVMEEESENRISLWNVYYMMGENAPMDHRQEGAEYAARLSANFRATGTKSGVYRRIVNFTSQVVLAKYSRSFFHYKSKSAIEMYETNGNGTKKIIPNRNALNDGNCIVLVINEPTNSENVIQACGANASATVKATSKKLAKMVNEGDFPPQSYDEISLGNQAIRFELPEDVPPAFELNAKSKPILLKFAIDYEDGQHGTEVRLPSAVSGLLSTAAYMLYTASYGGFFIWFGETASVSKQKHAARKVEKYMDDEQIDPFTSVTYMVQGKETPDFLINFQDFGK